MTLPPDAIIWFVIYGILMVIAISGNLLTVCAIIMCRRISELVSNYFVFSLALSDLLVGVAVPYHVVFTAGKLNAPKYLCILRFVLVIVGCFNSIYSILAIATDRYIAIIHPFHYVKYVKKKTVTVVIIVGWSLGVFTGGILFFWNHWQSDCSIHYLMPIEYLTYVLMPLFVIKWLAIFILYIKIWREAAAHAKRIKSVVLNKNIDIDERKSTQVVLLILGCFSLCWLPYFAVVTCLKILGDVPNVVYEITFTMGMCNSCLNPLIYAWKNKNFRKAFWLMLRCKSPNQPDPLEYYITNQRAMNSKRLTLASTSKSDTTSNNTELEMYDGKSVSNSENLNDWDQESASNTTAAPGDIHNYI